MSPLRFRAWHNGKMVYSYDLKMMPFGNEFFLASEGVYDDVADLARDAVVMQSTGLHDKNGKEIFEGDIVTYKYLSGFACEDEDYQSKGVEQKPGAVEFRNGEFWPREFYNDCEDGFYAYRLFDIEVIGNVHEHSHLLPKT